MPVFQTLIALAIILLLQLLFDRYAPGLDDVPGPFLAKFSNLWRLIETWKGHYERRMQELHRRHGNIVRIGPKIVSLTDPDAIECIYGVKADLQKSDFYKVMQTYHNGELVPTLLTVTEKKTHARLRKPVANIFAMSTLTHFEPLVDRTISDLVRILRRDFVDGRDPKTVCDIDHWLSYFAFDVMSGLSFSRSFGFLEHGRDVDNMMKNLRMKFKYDAIVGQMPALDKFLGKNPVFRRLFTKSSPFSTRAGKLFRDRMTQEKVEGDAIEDGKDRRDIVSRILQAKKAHPDQVPDAAVVGYIMTILLAGSDTVSITLRSIVYYLSKNPRMQMKLQREIDDSNPKYPISWRQAQNLKYLDAVVKEALRVHPPTSILLERVVSPAGLQLPNGRFLKPGTIVCMNGWTINQNEEVFGQDANIFNPERWLKADSESEDDFQARTKRMQRADIAFGYGTRSCLGKPIAFLEIYKLVPTLFGLFDVKMSRSSPIPDIGIFFRWWLTWNLQIRLADPRREWQYISYFVTEQHDMDVRLSGRVVAKGL